MGVSSTWGGGAGGVLVGWLKEGLKALLTWSLGHVRREAGA
jgi:hypothetical protein